MGKGLERFGEVRIVDDISSVSKVAQSYSDNNNDYNNLHVYQRAFLINNKIRICNQQRLT